MNRLLHPIRGAYGILLVLALVLPAAASAADGRTQLESFFDDLRSMRADFMQTLLDQNGEVIEKSEGVLLVERPGRFRLQYTLPYEHLYVADGERVWMYDPELEQVTVRDQSEALGNTPALLLSTSKPLEDEFTIKDLGVQDDVAWVGLTPKDQREGNFETIRIGLKDGWVRSMEMEDGLGQITRLWFYRFERNPQLLDKAFRFEPPPGVDVVGQQP